VVARVTNLSRSGIFVTASELPSPGTEVQCKLVLNGHRRVLRGRVAWVRGTTDDNPLRSPGAGIEFLDVTRQDDELLTRIISPPEEERVDVDVWFEGMAAPIRSRAVLAAEGLRLETKLPFLRLNSSVKVSYKARGLDEVREGTLDSVTLHPSDADGVPHLQLSVSTAAQDMARGTIEVGRRVAPVPAPTPGANTIPEAFPLGAMAGRGAPTGPMAAAGGGAGALPSDPLVAMPTLPMGTTLMPLPDPSGPSAAPGLPFPSAPPVSSRPARTPVSGVPALTGPLPMPSALALPLVPSATGSSDGDKTMRFMRPPEPQPASLPPAPITTPITQPTRRRWLGPVGVAGAALAVILVLRLGRSPSAPVAPPAPGAIAVETTSAGPGARAATPGPAAAPAPTPASAGVTIEPLPSTNTAPAVAVPVPESQRPLPGLQIEENGAETVLVLSLAGSAKGLEHYPLASPPGTAVNLPRARLKLPPGNYYPGHGFKQVWVQRKGNGAHVRFMHDPRTTTPDVQATDDEVRLVLRRR
jgi:hypothetical protein